MVTQSVMLSGITNTGETLTLETQRAVILYLLPLPPSPPLLPPLLSSLLSPPPPSSPLLSSVLLLLQSGKNRSYFHRWLWDEPVWNA